MSLGWLLRPCDLNRGEREQATLVCDRHLFPCFLGSVVENSSGGLAVISSGTCLFCSSKPVCYVSGKRRKTQNRMNLASWTFLPLNPLPGSLWRLASLSSKWGSPGKLPHCYHCHSSNRKGKSPPLLPREDLEYFKISSRDLYSNNFCMCSVSHISKIFTKIPTPAAICL